MTSRKTLLATGEIYHVFNKSIGGEIIFSGMKNLHRILNLTDFYRYKNQISYSRMKNLNTILRENIMKELYSSPPLVKLFVYAFMPNHYHFLMQQLEPKGISTFVSNLQNSYAKKFNLINKREGSVFKEMFRAVRIEADEEFIHVSRYIHLNPVTSYIINIDQLDKYPFTSFPLYLSGQSSLIDMSMILNHFVTNKKYKDFVRDQADYQRKLKNMSKSHLMDKIFSK